MLIDKGPPREGTHPYRYGRQRVDEWIRPKMFVLGGLMIVGAALLWVFEALSAITKFPSLRADRVK